LSGVRARGGTVCVVVVVFLMPKCVRDEVGTLRLVTVVCCYYCGWCKELTCITNGLCYGSTEWRCARERWFPFGSLLLVSVSSSLMLREWRSGHALREGDRRVDDVINVLVLRALFPY